MPIRSYLIQQFENTHENQFFRAVTRKLRNTYQDSAGLHILIGNLSCNGHQIDCLYISNGKIIVIDFKNYEGQLTFSENNPWKMSSGNDFVFVKGGGRFRNPFQQVNAYRYSMIQFLGNRQNEINDPNHNLNLGHISGLVLFHHSISFNENDIPQKIKSYFDIADINSYSEVIDDRISSQLNVTDNEIEKILNVLDVRAENLFDENTIDEIQEQKNAVDDSAERLNMVRRILTHVNASNEIEKILYYYLTLVSLERLKEPTLSSRHLYPVNWNSILNSISINIENNPALHQEFQQNRIQQFPKNFFVGVNIQYNNQSFPLLYNILQNNDINNHTSINCSIYDFDLYIQPLEERSYPDELIDELSTAIKQQNSIFDKVKVLKEYLGEDVKLLDSLTLSLSSESLFTSQLQSELKNILRRNLINDNCLIKNFLNKTAIDIMVDKIDSNDFIQITPLNAKQKEAIQYSFNQPLTVVTGPPGTGKTQVVINILANAVYHNKKILFASKNNQAVNNVKSRINDLIKEPNFLLRFGSKNEVRENTIPAIDLFSSRMHNNLIEDNIDEVNRLLDIFQESNREIKNAQEVLHKKEKLNQVIIPELQSKQDVLKSDYAKFIEDIGPDLFIIFNKDSLNNIHNILTNSISNKEETQKKNSGIRKLFFNIGWRKNSLMQQKSFFDKLPHNLKQYIARNNISIDFTVIRTGSDIVEVYANINRVLEKGINLAKQKIEYESNLIEVNSNLEKLLKERDSISREEPTLRNSIEENRSKLNKLGSSILNALITRRLFLGNASDIHQYKEYIPDNIPWQGNQLHEFVNTTRKFLDTFNITAITSLSIKNAFPLSDDLFDILVIDEASQCDIASAIPLILRSKQLVVIGDPMQLKHITKVKDYEEKYIVDKLLLNNMRLDFVNDSLYDYCYKLSIISRSQSVFLKEHYRCHPDIITYSNKAFYGPRMGQELDILTNPDNYSVEPKGIIWVDTVGEQHETRNLNNAEKNKTVELAVSLANQNKNISIGIATPFRNQFEAIRNSIPNQYANRIKVDTVHGFQGDEKDVMIVSLVVTYNSPAYKADWINNSVPYLLNVAVSRARNTLYIIGNANYCRNLPENSPLGMLVRYVDEKAN